MKVATLLGATAIALTLHSCNPKPGTHDDIDGYVAKDTANKMIESYLTSIKSEDNNSDRPNLNSLILEADPLRDYLQNPEIRRVKVMLAHSLEFINSGHFGQNAGYHSGELTIVLAGYNKDGDYVFSPGNRVLNHAMPCPRNCPDAGTASNATLR